MAKLSLALSNSESVRSCCLSMRCSLSVISAFCSSRSCTISWRSLVSLGDDDIMMILWWCYDGVMMTLWWRYDDVMMTLWCSQFLVKIDRGWWWRSIYLGKSMMRYRKIFLWCLGTNGWLTCWWQRSSLVWSCPDRSADPPSLYLSSLLAPDG